MNFKKSVEKLLLSFSMLIFASEISAAPLSIRIELPEALSISLGNTHWTYFLDGEIDGQAPARVKEALAKAGDNGIWVYLNSPGGNVLAGMEIGRLIRAAGATTNIGKRILGTEGTQPGECFSSCTLAFLGGTYRFQTQGSTYGVHRFSSQAEPSSSDLDIAQIMSATISNYIREMGVDLGLFDLMVKAGKDEIYTLTPDQEKKLLVVNDGRRNATWAIEVIDGVQYLRGMQDTVFGMGKMILTCLENKLTLHSIYQAGNKRASEIVSGSWENSLTINEIDISPLPKPQFLANNSGYLNSVFPLTSAQIQEIYAANSIGHIMQLDRKSSFYVGFYVDINQAAKNYVRGYIDSCSRLAKSDTYLRKSINDVQGGRTTSSTQVSRFTDIASSTNEQSPLQPPLIFQNADLNSMLAAAYNTDTQEVERIFGKFKLNVNLERGDRALARNRNTQGLAAIKKENYPDAATLFRQGSEADAGDAELINNYAYALQQMDNYRESIPLLEKTLLIAIDRPSAWFNLSDALASMNMPASACGALTLGLKFVKVPEQSISFLEVKILKETDATIAKRNAEILDCAKTRLN
jgi:tetratricopeptide (TPR) repeat protein